MIITTMKTCPNCGARLSLDSFYPRAKNCKECVKRGVSENRKKRIEYYREYDRQRAWDPERVSARAASAKRRKTDAGKRATDAARMRGWKERNADKHKAHNAVNNAISEGRLTAKPCERCGHGVGVQAHHEDYSRQLDVVWLCPPCHGKRHREINAERRKRAA